MVAAVIIMVSFNFGMLVLYALLACYQFSLAEALPSIRQVSTGHVPKLSLRSGLRFHVFLSHICKLPRPEP